MPTPQRHFKEELDALLDGQLDGQTRAQIEAHLETCVECQRKFEALRWTKEFAAQRFAAPAAPEDLRAKILRSLQPEQDRVIIAMPARHWWAQSRAAALACAAAVLIIAIGAALYFRPSPLLPALVANDYRDYRTNKLALDLRTGDVKEMEAFFAASGLPFATRVFDLGMMEYRLVGGAAHRLKDQPGALFVYRGPGGEELLCQMFPGTVTKLPAGAVRRENKGIEFYIYRSGALTAVFWQEGTIVCVLVSDIPTENVVQLAFAKAMIP